MSVCEVCGDPTGRDLCRSCSQHRRRHKRDRTDEEMAERRYAELQRRHEWSLVANYRRVTYPDPGVESRGGAAPSA